MAGKWQIDLEQKRASFGNFMVTFQKLGNSTFRLEVSNAPGLRQDEALEFAGEAAQAIADALRQKNGKSDSAEADESLMLRG